MVLGLTTHFLRGRREFFGSRGILLGDLVELLHRTSNLADPARLFFGSHGNFLNQFRSFGDIRNHFLQQAPGFFRHLDAIAGQFAYFGGSYLATFGQLSDFGRDYRKTLTMFPGSRRFDRGIEREHIGLIGDIFDDGDLLSDILHRLHGFEYR